MGFFKVGFRAWSFGVFKNIFQGYQNEEREILKTNLFEDHSVQSMSILKEIVWEYFRGHVQELN